MFVAYVFVFGPWAIGLWWLIDHLWRLLRRTWYGTGEGMRHAYVQVYRPMIERSK